MICEFALIAVNPPRCATFLVFAGFVFETASQSAMFISDIYPLSNYDIDRHSRQPLLLQSPRRLFLPVAALLSSRYRRRDLKDRTCKLVIPL
jgi:hypothetical protein